MGMSAAMRKTLSAAFALTLAACARESWPELAGPLPSAEVEPIEPVRLPPPARTIDPLPEGAAAEAFAEIAAARVALEQRLDAQWADYRAAKAEAGGDRLAWRTAQLALTRLGGLVNEMDVLEHRAAQLVAALPAAAVPEPAAAELLFVLTRRTATLADTLAAERTALAALVPES